VQAFTTGLRAGELRSLTLESVDVQAGALILDPAWTKNRKPGLQPIPRPLVGKLIEFGKAEKAKPLYERHYGPRDARPKGIPENPLLFVPTQTARDLRKDLKAAGVPDVKPGEGRVDFHACRAAYVTFVMEAGATAKEGQTLARHATPELTMNVYAKARDERLWEVVEKVGETILSGTNRALSVHSDAPEGPDENPNSLASNDLRKTGDGGGGGNRTRVPWPFWPKLLRT